MILDDIRAWPEKLQAGEQLAQDFYNQYQASLPSNIKNVAFFGMGGSGIAGRVVKTFLDREQGVTSHVIDYPDLPHCFGSDTLAIVVTYSGNTWETVSALKQLIECSVPTIVIAHAGQAKQIAQDNNLPFVQLPESNMPRAALGNFLGFMIGLFDSMGVLAKKQIINDFVRHAQQYMPQFSEKDYFSDFLSVAQGLPFFHVWGVSGDSAAFAYRAQTQFNENSKVQAVFSAFPELCHNLLVGFTQVQAKSLVVLFHSGFLSENLNRAIDATSEILREKGADLYKVPILGDTLEVQLFNMVLWSDFASCHLGQLHGVELTPVKIIDSLKQAHKQKGIVV